MVETEEYEEMEVTEDEYEERSGWDFFKSVIRTNLGPEVIEPDLPAESATKRSRPKVVNSGKKKTSRGNASQASNGRADRGQGSSKKSGKPEEEEDMETTTLPPCSLVLPIDIERGIKCYNDTEVWTRCYITKETFFQWSF